MLDYGYRSKCCRATIKIVHKRIKDTSVRKPIWVCNKCGSRDVDIITKEEARIQGEEIEKNENS